MAASKQDVKVSPVTKSESLVLMKNMIRISVSSICYMRELFPKDCFKNKEYGSVDIHQLQAAHKDDNGQLIVTNTDAFLLTQWLEKGVFGALECEYLSSMTFAIFCKHPKTGEDLLLESYEFKVSFQSDSVPKINDVSLISRDVVKNQAAKFIRSLTEFSGTLDSLPEERWITLQLKYRDITPSDYEPEYFCAAQSPFLGLDKMPLVINIGAVKTPNVDMKVKYAGLESFLFEDLSKVNNYSVNEIQSITTCGADGLQATSTNTKSQHTIGSTVNMFQGKSHVTTPYVDNNDNTGLVSEMSKVQVSNLSTVTSVNKNINTDDKKKKETLIDLANAAAKKQEMKEISPLVVPSEDITFNKVKTYILEKGISTVKLCAKTLSLNDVDVRAAFARLVQEGIIQPKKKTGLYGLSQDNQPSSAVVTQQENVAVIPITEESEPIAVCGAAGNVQDDPIEDTPPFTPHKQPAIAIPTTTRATAAAPLVMAAPVSKAVTPTNKVATSNSAFQPFQPVKGKLNREEFELQSFSQDSTDGAMDGQAKKARKFSVIKDPINLRTLRPLY